MPATYKTSLIVNDGQTSRFMSKAESFICVVPMQRIVAAESSLPSVPGMGTTKRL